MTLSFDTVDWTIGLTLIGGAALMIFIGCALAGRPLGGFVIALLGIALSVAVAAGIDLLLQAFTSEIFWGSGTYKRGAMRAFMPFSVGMTVGMVSSILLVGWISKGGSRAKDSADLMAAALEIRRARQAALDAAPIPGGKEPNR